MELILVDGEKHSIWNNADKQIEVLRDNGYKDIDVMDIETNSYEDGHYFV